MLLLETLAVGPFECNCSILADPDSKEALVVDPGGDAPKIAAIVRHYDLTVVGIVHTHAHIDHVFATHEVKQELGGAICLHREDLFLYDGIGMQAAFLGWQGKVTVSPVDRFVDDGDDVAFGRRAVLVLSTPGHTPGSICFALREEPGETPLLFSGDTLFHRGVGRTDLWGGDAKKLVRSIRERLYKLSPDTVVLPGHGPRTRIADEARENPFVRAT